jgi:hypothetical protein
MSQFDYIKEIARLALANDVKPYTILWTTPKKIIEPNLQPNSNLLSRILQERKKLGN